MIWNIQKHKGKYFIVDGLRNDFVHKGLSLDELEERWFERYPRTFATEKSFVESVRKVDYILKEEEKETTLNVKLQKKI